MLRRVFVLNESSVLLGLAPAWESTSKYKLFDTDESVSPVAEKAAPYIARLEATSGQRRPLYLNSSLSELRD